MGQKRQQWGNSGAENNEVGSEWGQKHNSGAIEFLRLKDKG